MVPSLSGTPTLASSGAATRTSTPEAQAHTAAGPTRSIAKTASETGSGISGPGANLCIRIFRQPPKRARPCEACLFARRVKVALKTFFRAPGRVAFLAIRARFSSLIDDQYHKIMTVLRTSPRYGARKTVTYN